MKLEARDVGKREVGVVLLLRVICHARTVPAGTWFPARGAGHLRVTTRCPTGSEIGEALDVRLDPVAQTLQGLRGVGAEPGNQDYVLFESRSEPGTFYMREAFDDRTALDTHFATPHFQAFADGVEALLTAPLELLFLDRRSE